MISEINSESRSHYWWMGSVVAMVFLFDLLWYSLELSGRIGLIGGVYSTIRPSAYISSAGLALWLVFVIGWSFAVAAAIRLTHRGKHQRTTTLALITAIGTVVYYFATHPLLLPFVAARAGMQYAPKLLDAWYGRRMNLTDVLWIGAIHAAWLIALLSIALRRRQAEHSLKVSQ